MGVGDGVPLNSSSILDSCSTVVALAFIDASEPWHKTGIGGWKMNEVEKGNDRVQNKRKEQKGRKNAGY
jgi:hypothetical protein